MAFPRERGSIRWHSLPPPHTHHVSTYLHEYVEHYIWDAVIHSNIKCTKGHLLVRLAHTNRKTCVCIISLRFIDVHRNLVSVRFSDSHFLRDPNQRVGISKIINKSRKRNTQTNFLCYNIDKHGVIYFIVSSQNCIKKKSSL